MMPSLWGQVDYVDVARFCSTAGKDEAALDACAIGMRLHGRTPELLVRSAIANDALGRFDRAIADCAEALRSDPAPATRALAGATRAFALESIGAPQAARDAAEMAVLATPDAIAPHCAYGNLLAWSGDWERAWPELECHWLSERATLRRRFALDEWDGEDIAAKRVVVAHTQGIGDFIQMARYLPLLRARCAHVTVECTPSFAPLLQTMSGVDAIVNPGSTNAAGVEVFARLMSLPRIFGERGAAASMPYLAVPPAYAQRWTEARTNATGLRAGLAWAGNPFHQRDRVRSLPIAACAPWAEIPGIVWTSLQIGPGARDAGVAKIPFAQHYAAINDFADTAALIAHLDLVIAVDTAVAHLAGALGKPVWLLLSQRPDWRWSRASETTPWYGSMRIFHANEPGWAGVIADVSRSLRTVAERVQRISADRVDNSAERPKVSDTMPRRAFVSQARGGRRTP